MQRERTYTRKPPTVKAIQWTGDNAESIIYFAERFFTTAAVDGQISVHNSMLTLVGGSTFRLEVPYRGWLIVDRSSEYSPSVVTNEGFITAYIPYKNPLVSDYYE